MSSLQSIPGTAPRVRIGLGTVLTGIGVIIATAATIIILALNSANHTTAGVPATTSLAAATSPPQTHYLGPRQVRAGLNPQNDPSIGPAAGIGNAVPRYTCLGAAQRCLR